MRLVLQGNCLIFGADDYLVLTYYIAHTDCVNTDFLGGALSLPCSAAVGICLGANRADFVRKHKSCAAGGIKLSVMVLFYNFNFCLGHCKRHGPGKLYKKRYTQRHIGRMEYRDFL